MTTLKPHSIFQTLQSSNLFLKCCPVSWQCFVSDGGERSTQSGAGSLWWGGIKFGNHKLGQQIQSGTQQLFLPATDHLPQLRPLFNQKTQNYHKLSSNIQQGQISSCGDKKNKANGLKISPGSKTQLKFCGNTETVVIIDLIKVIIDWNKAMVGRNKAMVGRTKAIDSVSYLQTWLTGWYLIFRRYHKYEKDLILIDDPTSTKIYMFILTHFKD